MREKILKLIKELNKGLIEREDTIKIALLTMLAQENIILVGPPGTAKSEISRRMAQAVKDDSYFEYLLTKFTTPEEIFGPLSIKELKEDKFKRNTEGYMPTAKITFLDEIFKANSAILNSLLTIINEKKFHNGNKKEDVPLISLVGASNELPLNDESLKALYDRFLVRQIVNYISDEKISELMDISGEECKILDKNKISLEELNKIKENIKNIEIPDRIKILIEEIRKKLKEEFKENKIEDISDRRLVKIVKLLKVSAYTNGRKEVDESDVLLLMHCLWSDSNNAENIGKMVTGLVKTGLKKLGYETAVLEKKDIKKVETKREAGKLMGEGTKENPFLIENEHDLYSLHDVKYRDEIYYFEQINDIDLTNIKDWDPIGNFKGIYEGNSKKILNLKIIRNNIQNIGLFGIIEKDAEVKNLIIESVNIEISDANIENMNIGGISGISNGIILNIKLEGSINSKNCKKISSGGIAGDNIGIILNSEVSGTISSSSSSSSSYYSYSGGIAGNNIGSILNSKVSGTISSSSFSSSSSSSGGIAGNNIGSILNSEVSGTISSSSSYYYSYSGGITGINGGKIENSIVSAKEIEGKCRKRICVIGSNGQNKNSYAVETVLLNGAAVKSSDSNEGDGKDVALSLLTKTFYTRMLKWDFDNVWEWDEKNKKPILKNSFIEEKPDKEFNVENAKKIIESNIWL